MVPATAKLTTPASFLLTTGLIMAPNETRNYTWVLQLLHGEQTVPLICLPVGSYSGRWQATGPFCLIVHDAPTRIGLSGLPLTLFDALYNQYEYMIDC